MGDTTDEQGANGNGSGGDDGQLAADLDDWVFAGRGFVRGVGRLGRSLPPFGPDQRAEVGHLVAVADAEFDRLVAAWQTTIRPALEPYEYASSPGWVAAGTGEKPYAAQSPPTLDPSAYSDGYWVDYWVGGATALFAIVDGLRACVPPADEGVAWSLASHHIPRADEQFAWMLNGYTTAVRPRLRKYARRVTRW